MTVVFPVATASSGTMIRVGYAEGTIIGSGAPRLGLPMSIPADEIFFWTRRWQEGEIESAAAREAGEVRRFPNGRAAVSWLLSEDDDA